jgi:hypothetical protein
VETVPEDEPVPAVDVTAVMEVAATGGEAEASSPIADQCSPKPAVLSLSEQLAALHEIMQPEPSKKNEPARRKQTTAATRSAGMLKIETVETFHDDGTDTEYSSSAAVPYVSQAAWKAAELKYSTSSRMKLAVNNKEDDDDVFYRIGEVSRAITLHRPGVPVFILVNVALAGLLWFLSSRNDGVDSCVQFIPIALLAAAIDIVVVQCGLIAVRARWRVVTEEKAAWRCELHPFDGQKRHFL